MEQKINHTFNGNDIATSIAEQDGIIFVSGQTQVENSEYVNYTVAYGQAKIKEIPDLLGEEKSSNLFYIPNDGQLANDTGAIASDVLFYVPSHYPSLFVNHHGLSYVFKKFTNDTVSNDTIHRIDMQFMRGNYLAKAVVYPNKEVSNHYQNYYLPHCSNGVIDVRGSNMLMAESMYDGIDLYYSSNQTGEKHYWVLAPNANYKAIKIKFNGADSVSTPQGKYTIHSSIGKIEYDSLVAYEIDAVGNIIIGTSQPMRLMLDTSSNSYYFKTFSYNASNTLVILAKQKQNYICLPPNGNAIDNLSWSTFFGDPTPNVGTAFEGFGNSKSSNIVASGSTSSDNFPTQMNVIQSINSYSDAFFIKFNENGTPLYITFFGGASYEDNTSVAVHDSLKSVFLTGRTRSPSLNFPSTFTNQNYNAGLDDIFITRFDLLTGYLMWWTYFGGNGYDWNPSCTVDYVGNLYVGGVTESNNLTNITPSGAFNEGFGGNKDAFICKFTTDGVLIWNSYLGGTDMDMVEDLDVEGNKLLITGSTASITNNSNPSLNTVIPITTGYFPIGCAYNSGYIDGVIGINGYNGKTDAYVCEFDLTTLVLKWSTYYGGDDNENIYNSNGSQTKRGQVKSKLISNNHFTYIAGTTSALSDFPVLVSTNINSFNQGNLTPLSTTYEAFLVKFIDRNLSWSTLFGGDNIEYNTSLEIGDDNRVYIGGTTKSNIASISANYCLPGVSGSFPLCNSNSNLPTHFFNNTFNSALSNYEGYLACFDLSDNMQWSTYLGGNSRDDLYDIVFHQSITGGCSLFTCGRNFSNCDFPWVQTNPSSYYQYNISTNNSIILGFISRFDIDPFCTLTTNNVWIEDSDEIIIYPNPSEDYLIIENLKDKVYSIEVKNVLGQSIPVHSNILNNKVKISFVQRPTTGIYTITAIMENSSFNRKFIIK